MSEIIGAFLCAEIGNGATDPTPEARDRMLGRLAQMRLEFAEGHGFCGSPSEAVPDLNDYSPFGHACVPYFMSAVAALPNPL